MLYSFNISNKVYSNKPFSGNGEQLKRRHPVAIRLGFHGGRGELQHGVRPQPDGDPLVHAGVSPRVVKLNSDWLGHPASRFDRQEFVAWCLIDLL